MAILSACLQSKRTEEAAIPPAPSVGVPGFIYIKTSIMIIELSAFKILSIMYRNNAQNIGVITL